MIRALVAVLLGLIACNDTSGEVLTTLDGDGGVPGPDADLTNPDADPDANPECRVDPPCPTPSILGVSVCGRVVDVETSEVIKAPTDVAVQFFNLIDFGSGPFLAEVIPDECGWFEAEDIGGLIPGVLVMSTDDQGSSSNYSRVVSVLSSSFGQPLIANAPVLREAVDQAWGDAAGLGGQSFSDVGALLLMFFDGTEPEVFPYRGTPVTGVTLTEEGTPQPSDDYYFSDTNPLLRVTVDPGLATTGADGAGLLVGTLPINDYSGAKLDCTFGATNGVIPGIVQAQEIYGSCN